MQSHLDLTNKWRTTYTLQAWI